jgi:WD40 repeat protein/Ca2+-binding EF-hand superfamily protein
MTDIDDTPLDQSDFPDEQIATKVEVQEGRADSGTKEERPATSEETIDPFKQHPDSDSDEEHADAPPSVSGMEIMMALEGSALNELRGRFEKKEAEEGDGLNLTEFVETFLEFLKPNEATRKYLVTDLVELFSQIDINGDGTCEWEEFTSFCVEAGLLATRRVKLPLKYHFVEDKRFVDKYTKGELDGITWIPEISRLAVREKGNHVCKMYDKKFVMRGEVDLRKGIEFLLKQGHSQEGQPEQDPEDTKANVLSVCYITRKNLLVVATSDLAISLWECGIPKTNPHIKTTQPQKPDEYRFCGQIHTSAMVLTLKWCPESECVWAIGGHEVDVRNTSSNENLPGHFNHPGIIQGYRVKMTTAGGLKDFYELEPKFRLAHFHKACAMDMVEIRKDGVLVTSSMDKEKNLALWDVHTKKWKSALVGHKRGVVSLAYAPDHGLLVSAGFEYDALVWDVKGSKFPIMAINGHHASLIGIKICPFQSGSNAVTCDRKGNFKMWDIRRSTHSKAMLLEAWNVTTGVGGFVPKNFDIVYPGRDCLTAGYNLHVFRCRRKRTTEMIPSFIVYNEEFMQFAVAFSTDVIMYDAGTGKELVNHRHIGKSEITSMTLDRRNRKLVIGYHNGEILVHNFMNGAIMKRFYGHQSDVTCLFMSKPDDCVVSTSWDKSVRVFDEAAPGEGLGHPPSVGAIRSVSDVHSRDVVCMALSYSLSLVATAATDFNIRLWDFQQLKMEPDGNYKHHKAEVTAIQFVEPYPALVSADCTGVICLWTVRPDVNRGRVLHVFENLSVVNDFVSLAKMEKIERREKAEEFAFLTGMEVDLSDDEADPDEDLQAVAVNACALAVGQSGPILYTGDDIGYIKMWDLSPFLRHYNIKPLQKSITTLNSYNAKRRLHRSAKGDMVGESLDSKQPSVQTAKVNTELKVPMMKMWKAHSDAINNFYIVNQRPFCLVSSSMDLGVRVWGLDGGQLGSLVLSSLEKQRVNSGRELQKPWLLVPPIRHRRHERLRHGKEVMQSVDDEIKAKKALARRMSLRTPTSELFAHRPKSPPIISPFNTKFNMLLKQLHKEEVESLPPLKDARGQNYGHFKIEKSKEERGVGAEIMRRNVDLGLSPFLKEELGDTWHPPSVKKKRTFLVSRTRKLPGTESAPELALHASQQSGGPEKVCTPGEEEKRARAVEAAKVRKRIRLRKTLTRVHSMLAEAEMMENVKLVASESEKLHQVHSSIFGSRASEFIPLKKDPSNSGPTHRVRHFGPYTTQDVQAMRALFNSYDEDGSGTIETAEFMNSDNMQHSHLFENASSMFASIDKDGSGSISFMEMCESVFPNLPDAVYQDMLDYVTVDEESQRKQRKITLKPSQIDEIKQIFKLYDADSSGEITIDELYGALAASHGTDTSEFENYFSMEELRDLVLQYDADGNETLDMDEFVTLFHENFYDDESGFDTSQVEDNPYTRKKR